MNKKLSALLSASASIAVCASLIAGSTFALFTSESKTNIAITAGKVKVTAAAAITRVYSAEWNDGEKKYTEKDTYNVETGEQDGPYTFTNTGTASLAENGTLMLTNITPGDGVEFKISAENESNVAIRYQTVVTFVSGGAVKEDGTVNETDSDSSLFRALEISISDEEGAPLIEEVSSKSTAVSKWTNVAKDGEIAPVNVSIKFPIEDKDQNQLQGMSCKLAVGIYAVQANGNDTTNQDVYFVTSDSNLNDVFDNAEDGDTVALAEDLTMPDGGLTIGEGGAKDVNVDLSGKTFGVNKSEEESGSLTVSKGSILTVTDSTSDGENAFAVNTSANSNNNPSDREPSTHTTDNKAYTMKVEGTLNFEDVDVAVENKAGDVGICVDGGTINFNKGTDLVINGRAAKDGYGTDGFGKGFYVTDGGTITFKNANVQSEGAVTSFVVGGGTEESTLTIDGGTFTFNDMYNSVNLAHPTFVSAFQTYENGTININGAKLNLTGKAENKASTSLGGTENETEYTNMILISCMGGGDVNVADSTITLAPELGTAFVAQTVCSYYYEDSATDCEHAEVRHRGVQCDACVTFSGSTKIYLDSTKHQTNSEACYVFAASRNGKQLGCYENGSNNWVDDVKTNTDSEITDEQVATHPWQEPEDGDQYTIKVGKNVEIYFSNVGANASVNPEFYKVESNSDLMGTDDREGGDGTNNTHEHYYVYDLAAVQKEPSYKYFINRYSSDGIQFNYDAE